MKLRQKGGYKRADASTLPDSPNIIMSRKDFEDAVPHPDLEISVGVGRDGLRLPVAVVADDPLRNPQSGSQIVDFEIKRIETNPLSE